MKYCRVDHVLRWISELCWRKKEEIPVVGKSYAIGSAVAGQQAVCLDYVKAFVQHKRWMSQNEIYKNAPMT